MTISRYIRRAIKIVAGLALCVAGSIALLLAILWLDHRRETTLPTPTGSYTVGRTTCIWTDTAHVDVMAPKPVATRELFAWIWYPAAPQQSFHADDYMPASWRIAFDRRTSPLFTQFANRELSRVRTHSVRDADLSPQQASYPVVFMRAGAAALTAQYTSLAEDLASHGYVVVGFDAPYRSAVVVRPDGSVVERAPQNNIELAGDNAVQLATKLAETWSSDMSFALDQLERLNTSAPNASDPAVRFTGRLDLQRVGAFGHSLGGATVLQFCHDDGRCKAGVDVDGLLLGSVIQEGLAKPFLFLLSDHSGEPDGDTKPVMANFQSIYDRLPSDKRWWIMIRGAGHFRFSDGAVLQIQPIVGVLHAVGILRLDGRRQVAITEHYLRTFFDVYLKGADPALLRSSAAYPEVEYIR